MKNGIIFLLITVFFSNVKGYGQNAPTITLNTEDMNLLREESFSVKRISDAKSELLRVCDQILTNKRTYSVTYNGSSLKGVSSNNYISYRAYMWPNPYTKSGLPYVLIDGKRNPQNDRNSDRPILNDLSRDIFQLGLAYFYTNEEKYVKRAIVLLDCFFIDSKTRMEPNFNFSQIIPDQPETGGATIEAAIFIDILEGIQFMRSSPNFSPRVDEDLKKWFRDFITWAEENPKGRINKGYQNNRGTYYTLLRCDIAVFLNDIELAKKIFEKEAFKRVIDQISSEGEMKYELRRATPLGYLKYNLQAFDELDEIGKKIGFDLYNYQGPKGQGLKKAFEWLDRYKTGESIWTYSPEVGITNHRRIIMKDEDEMVVKFSVERFDNYLEILTHYKR